jgi:hypothetical protein
MCKNCIHFRKCKWLIGCRGTEVMCDWIPSRYIEADELFREAVAQDEEDMRKYWTKEYH